MLKVFMNMESHKHINLKVYKKLAETCIICILVLDGCTCLDECNQLSR